MDYYHRRHRDGSCETICTRCFVTLGRATELAELKLIETAHICPAQTNSLKLEGSIGANQLTESIKPWVDLDARLWHFLGEMDAAHTLLLLFAIVVCSYLLPTFIELEMTKYIGVWISCIVFGNLVGCSLLSGALGLRKTGLLLYGFLTSCEGGLYVSHLVSPHLLVWLVDLVPTLAIAGLVVFLFLKSRFDRAVDTTEPA